MPNPGDAVRDEPAYKKLPADKRDYWEKGANKDLTQAQKDKLADECAKAGKYNRKSKTYSDDFPTAKDGKVDHGAVLRNAKEYVHDKLQPAADKETARAPPRPLGGMIDLGSSPDAPQNPPDNPATGHNAAAPDWVCINHAEYLAALMRCLGYPVREANVKLTKWLDSWHLNQVDYQEAAVQVWFGGKWHFADPYHCIFDPACVLETYSTYKRWLLYVWDGTTSPSSYMPVNNKGKAGDWVQEDETGNDLQKRFYSLAPSVGGSRNALLRGDGWHDACVYSSDPAPKWIPGVVIAPVSEHGPGHAISKLSLVDDEERITDGVRGEIPGTSRSVGGTLVPFVKGRKSEEDHIPTVHAGEFIFIGAESLIPRFDEIGTRDLTLQVRGPAGVAIPLSWAAALSDYPVTIEGLPPEVIPGATGVVPVPIRVTIDPANPPTHLLFTLMRCCSCSKLRLECQCEKAACCLDVADYPIAEDFLIACGRRRAVWLKHVSSGADVPISR